MLQDSALDQTPNAVGKYRVIAKLGEGGMAHVFLAVAHGPVGFSKLAVLKVVRPHLAQDPDILDMFLDEARLAGRLNHANVVQTYEVGEEDGRYVLVMEYLEGQPMRAIQKCMRHRGLDIPLPLQLKILIDALSGLHYAHELRDFDGTPLALVHRDVSPHNIFVTYDGQVKVLDFGIAKATTSSQETKSGVLKGKISYMAPEQFQVASVDRRADIYAMGAILWQTATGYRLWKGANDAQVMYAVSHGQIPRPSDVASAVPVELERICMRALAPNPAERYATAEEMQRDLRLFASELSTAVSALELGAFVAKEFAKERRELRDRLEHRLSRSATGSVPLMNLQNPLLATASSMQRTVPDNGEGAPTGDMTPPSGSLPSYLGSVPQLTSTPPPGTGSFSDAGMPTTNSTASQFQAIADIGGPRTTSRKGIFIAVVTGGLLAFAAVGGFAMHLFAADTKPAANTSPVASSPPLRHEASTHAPPAPERDATPKHVEVEIKAAPSHATLYLDGRALSGNPVIERLPRDGKVHPLTIEAPGYVTRRLEVKADQSRMLEVELKAERSHARPTKPKKPPSPSNTSGTPPSHTAPPQDPGLATDNIDPWTK